MTFQSLGLIEALLKAVRLQGYKTPSTIQQKAIPPILEGLDVLASAQTGTGKTAGFTLPMLQILSKISVPHRRPVRALVLTPTRELANQVFTNIKHYSEFLDLRTAVIFGGVNQNPQIKQLQNGVDVLVATPGRLIDLENQGHLSLSKVEIFVLDEADRMLDMGFKRDIDKIRSLIPCRRQNLMFSATFSREIKSLAQTILKSPILVEATPGNTTVESISQQIYRVAKVKKTKLLIKLINDGQWQQVLVFTRTKHCANKLCKKLERARISAMAIHGNKSQGARTRALAGFKNHDIRVLVATDIAARGLDIPLLPHVVNYELPNIPEDYVHRIGRTGRAGANGVALSLVCAEETSYLASIEKLTKQRLKKEIIKDFEPDPNASTLPPKKGGGRQRHVGGRPINKHQGPAGGGNRSKNKRRR
jgi:ATP-dependent RNA helicase RhlE